MSEVALCALILIMRLFRLIFACSHLSSCVCVCVSGEMRFCTLEQGIYNIYMCGFNRISLLLCYIVLLLRLACHIYVVDQDVVHLIATYGVFPSYLATFSQST